ncbi:hypothetical protein [Paraburkholderia sp. BL23I1N1]|uniref:hypothetical protein n=1 Tax=Paraburkholderia sp. BL23I1N1 TaxID=1938802 RepID=UPI00217CCBDC|nr:hypothetical protein [Paraburkholderia sp. BL23I1N1]
MTDAIGVPARSQISLLVASAKPRSANNCPAVSSSSWRVAAPSGREARFDGLGCAGCLGGFGCAVAVFFGGVGMVEKQARGNSLNLNSNSHNIHFTSSGAVRERFHCELLRCGRT